MHSVRRFAPWGLAALLVSSVGLQAQEAETNFSLDWKTRLGYTTSTKDELRSSYLGFGMNFGYKVGPGKVGFELGYIYNSGDNYFTSMPDTSKITPSNADGTTGKQALDPQKTVEDKRNEFSGITVRLSYQQEFSSSKDFAWQAGLQLGGKFKHQYIGECRSVKYEPTTNADGTTTPVAANSWRDVYTAVPYKSALNPSFFAGVIWHVDKESSLEFNLMLLNYTAIDYHHYAGTASNYHDATTATGPVSDDQTARSVFPYDKLETKNSMVPHIEVTYTFHF
jgi:hypothetical protein